MKTANKEPAMRKVLQALLAVGGATAIFISLLHIVIGPACIPGSVRVNATMDSEDRFYATIFLAYGASVLWCSKNVEQKTEPIRLLALIFFMGGLARIISAVFVGPPHQFFIAMTALELVFPLLLVWLASRVSSASASNKIPNRPGQM
jgi:hypothetical protein